MADRLFHRCGRRFEARNRRLCLRACGGGPPGSCPGCCPGANCPSAGVIGGPALGQNLDAFVNFQASGRFVDGSGALIVEAFDSFDGLGQNNIGCGGGDWGATGPNGNIVQGRVDLCCGTSVPAPTFSPPVPITAAPPYFAGSMAATPPNQQAWRGSSAPMVMPWLGPSAARSMPAGVPGGFWGAVLPPLPNEIVLGFGGSVQVLLGGRGFRFSSFVHYGAVGLPLYDLREAVSVEVRVPGLNLCVPGTLGACCKPQTVQRGRQCIIVTQADCATAQGQWKGVGSTCDDCVEPVGACCDLPTGCEVKTQAGCGQAGGTWLGANVPCGFCPPVVPPTLGSCCCTPPNGVCVDNVTAQECANLNGANFILGGVCGQPDGCPPPNLCPVACCFGLQCVTYPSAGACQQAGGIFHSVGGCGPHVVCGEGAGAFSGKARRHVPVRRASAALSPRGGGSSRLVVPSRRLVVPSGCAGCRDGGL